MDEKNNMNIEEETNKMIPETFEFDVKQQKKLRNKMSLIFSLISIVLVIFIIFSLNVFFNVSPLDKQPLVYAKENKLFMKNSKPRTKTFQDNVALNADSIQYEAGKNGSDLAYFYTGSYTSSAQAPTTSVINRSEGGRYIHSIIDGSLYVKSLMSKNKIIDINVIYFVTNIEGDRVLYLKNETVGDTEKSLLYLYIYGKKPVMVCENMINESGSYYFDEKQDIFSFADDDQYFYYYVGTNDHVELFTGKDGKNVRSVKNSDTRILSVISRKGEFLYNTQDGLYHVDKNNKETAVVEGENSILLFADKDFNFYYVKEEKTENGTGKQEGTGPEKSVEPEGNTNPEGNGESEEESQPEITANSEEETADEKTEENIPNYKMYFSKKGKSREISEYTSSILYYSVKDSAMYFQKRDQDHLNENEKDVYFTQRGSSPKRVISTERIMFFNDRGETLRFQDQESRFVKYSSGMEDVKLNVQVSDHMDTAAYITDFKDVPGEESPGSEEDGGGNVKRYDKMGDLYISKAKGSSFGEGTFIDGDVCEFSISKDGKRLIYVKKYNDKDDYEVLYRDIGAKQSKQLVNSLNEVVKMEIGNDLRMAAYADKAGDLFLIKSGKQMKNAVSDRVDDFRVDKAGNVIIEKENMNSTASNPLFDIYQYSKNKLKQVDTGITAVIFY